jgi:hypothetical protein
MRTTWKLIIQVKMQRPGFLDVHFANHPLAFQRIACRTTYHEVAEIKPRNVPNVP